MWMVTIVAFAVLVCLASSAIHAQRTRDRQRVPPTLSDVSYGDHPQQKIDLYLAESEQPTPLVLFIHGGGFRGGSKRAVNRQPFLDAGISLAAIEYRFVLDCLCYPLSFRVF
jgi:acetyl esterase/lipase